MNVPDLAAFILLPAAFGYGCVRGFISRLFSAAGFVVALLVAWWWADETAVWISSIPAVSAFLQANGEQFLPSGGSVNGLRISAFVLLFLAVKAGLTAAGLLFNLAAKAAGMSALNRIAGGVLAVLETGLLLAVAFLLLSFHPDPNVQAALAQSALAPYFLDGSRLLLEHVFGVSVPPAGGMPVDV